MKHDLSLHVKIHDSLHVEYIMTVSTEEKRHHRNSRLESIKGKRNSHVEEGYTCTCQSLYNIHVALIIYSIQCYYMQTLLDKKQRKKSELFNFNIH